MKVIWAKNVNLSTWFRFNFMQIALHLGKVWKDARNLTNLRRNTKIHENIFMQCHRKFKLRKYIFTEINLPKMYYSWIYDKNVWQFKTGIVSRKLLVQYYHFQHSCVGVMKTVVSRLFSSSSKKKIGCSGTATKVKCFIEGKQKIEN